MTVTAQTPRSGPYSGNGSTTAFDYGFLVEADTEIVVTVADAAGATTIKTLTTDYTVSGVGSSGGGDVTFVTAPLGTEKVAITRTIAMSQATDLQNRKAVVPQVLEDAYDKLTRITQDHKEQLGRSVKVDLFGSTDLPALTIDLGVVADIASDVSTVAANSANVTIAADNIVAIQDAPDEAAAAAASAAAALVSEDAAAASEAAAFASVTTTQNLFSGDDTTTNFTLPYVPVSVNGINVYIDGVHQDNNSVSTSGTTLVFAEAPPTGTDNIVVRMVATGVTNFTTYTNLVVKKQYTRFELLLADTADGTYFTVGDLVEVIEGGFSYKVATGGEVANAGGVQFTIVSGPCLYDTKLTPEASSVVSTADYSSFPSLAGKNAELVVAYHHGVNHGQSDYEAVALNQTTVGAAALVLNGNEAAGGSVSTWATQVVIEAAADESARTFTVVGTLAGASVTITSIGPDAGKITLTGNIDVITSVTIDGATTGNVSVGLLRIACNIETKKSTDGGATWSAAQALGDGMTTGQYRYYYPALGVTKLGSYILVYEQVDVTTGVAVPKYRTSPDGTTWSEETNMVIGGEAASVFAFYGKISVTPSGRLVLGAYLSTKQYVLVSDDQGVSWTASIQRTESAFTTSEMSFAIVSELVWLSWIRIDDANGTLVQMKTVDGGLNWTDMGQISVLPVAGGYKSHDSVFVTLNGTRYIFLAIMSRDASTDGLHPNTIIGKFGRVSDIVASAAGFFAGEDVLVADLETWPRNGYPSIVVDPYTNECVMAYHTETGDRTSKVLTRGFNVGEVVYGADGWAAFTPTVTSTAGTEPAFNIQLGRWARQGKFLDFEADVRVDGVIGWSGNLVVDLSDIGSFVFDSPVNSFATVGIIENADLLSRGLYDISAEAQDGALELALWHSRDVLTSSALAGFEVNDDFRIKVSGRLRVK